MTIKSFSTAVMDPTSTAITAPRFSIGSVHNVGVHLIDETGTEGFGYAYVFDPHSAVAMRSLIDLLAQSYVGTEARELRRVRSELLTTKVNFLGVRGLVRVAASAVDMAVWDLHCRLLNTNLAGLIGTERTAQPGFTAAGLWSGLSPDECARIAPEVAAEFKTPHVKMWLGSKDLHFERDRVVATRESLASGAGLIIDAAQAYDWRTAAKLAGMLDGQDITWFEDPVEYEDLDGLRAFAAEAPMPMGTGEHIYGLDQLKQLLDQGSTQYVVLDLQRIGGITDFLAAAALCEAYRVELVNHCHPHTSLQLLAASRTGSWCELAPLWDGYFGRLAVEEGLVKLDLSVLGIGLGNGGRGNEE
jgi:mandelate racemase